MRRPDSAIVSASAIVLLASALSVRAGIDTFIALVAGREVAREGIPYTERLTSQAAGREWIDQQWLSQLAIHGAERAGGLAAVIALGLVCVTLAAGIAAHAARRAGAPAAALILVALAVSPIFGAVSQPRTQSLALPIAAALVWLLLDDAGRMRWRTLALCAPLMVLWANIHGSVLVGSAMCVLAAALGGVGAARVGSRARLVRAIALALSGVLSVAATPYGTGIVRYYAAVLGGDRLSGVVVEWGPATIATSPASFALAGVGILLIARGRPRALEALLLALVVGLGLESLRGGVWLALVAIAVMPVLAGRAFPALGAARTGRVLSIAAAALLVASVGVSLRAIADPTRGVPRSHDASAIAQAAGADGRIVASERLADWLLWERPELAGRVAFDARYELARYDELDALNRYLNAAGHRWCAPAEGATTLVLDRDARRLLREAVLHRDDARVIHRSSDLIVVRTDGECA